jgi:hypothetical protein
MSQNFSLSQKGMHPAQGTVILQKNPLEKETDLETVISPGVGLGPGTGTVTEVDGTGVIEMLILD